LQQNTLKISAHAEIRQAISTRLNPWLFRSPASHSHRHKRSAAKQQVGKYMRFSEGPMGVLPLKDLLEGETISSGVLLRLSDAVARCGTFCSLNCPMDIARVDAVL
jgi:hypothetical protein